MHIVYCAGYIRFRNGRTWTMWHREMQLWLCKHGAKPVGDRVWSRVNNKEDKRKFINNIQLFENLILFDGSICFSNLFFKVSCTIYISLLISSHHLLCPCTKLPDQCRLDRFSQLCCIGFLTRVILHFCDWLLSLQSIFLHYILMYYFKILFCFL